eukprot:989617-Prymnesium_polylepis.2
MLPQPARRGGFHRALTCTRARDAHALILFQSLTALCAHAHRDQGDMCRPVPMGHHAFLVPACPVAYSRAKSDVTTTLRSFSLEVPRTRTKPCRVPPAVAARRAEVARAMVQKRRLKASAPMQHALQSGGMPSGMEAII